MFAKIAVVLLMLLACYWLQATSLFAIGLFAALHFVYAIVTLAHRARVETAAIERASSETGIEVDELPAQAEDSGRYGPLELPESTRQL